jgi:hypothetical protein
MRTLTGIGLGLGLALGGCAAGAGGAADVQEASAEDVPVRFAYGGLGPADAIFTTVKHPRTGFSVRRASYNGRTGFAVFDLMETIGDSYFTPKAPGAYIEQFLKPGAAIERGGSGTTSGSRQTKWRAFRLSEPGASCVELQRSLREHVEGGLDNYSQALVVGVYCRAGEGQIPPDEVAEIAKGLSA